MKTLARIAAAVLLAAGLLPAAGCGATAENRLHPDRWNASSPEHAPACVHPAIAERLDSDLDWILSRRKGGAAPGEEAPRPAKKRTGERPAD